MVRTGRASRNGKRSLVPESEPSQTTKTGLEIPIPTQKDFERALRKVATTRGPGKRQKPKP
jgi:hypothetical protein